MAVRTMWGVAVSLPGPGSSIVAVFEDEQEATDAAVAAPYDCWVVPLMVYPREDWDERPVDERPGEEG